MGLLIVLVAVVGEVTLATFCISTKSNQTTIRSIVRVTALAAFLLLAVLPIIDWGSRYYALAALLLLLAATGTVVLIRHKPEQPGSYRAARVIKRTTAMTMLILVATLPAVVFPQHQAVATTGGYEVATASYTYTDPARIETYTTTGENRRLNVELWYPGDATEKYPLIVFSHGSFGVKSSNQSLFNELASHGYVVISVDHTFQSVYTTDDHGRITLVNAGYVKEVSGENAHTKKQQSLELYQKWMSLRMADINFVIDHTLAEAGNRAADPVYQRVDTHKIGVMGHSLGGSAALGIGRVRHDVSAVLALEAPFMYDIKGVRSGQFIFTTDAYPVPVLNVYSDSSWEHLSEWAQYAENYRLLSSPDASTVNVHISGAGHLDLTDLTLTSPILTRLLNGQQSTRDSRDSVTLINQLSLTFFDANLK